MKKRIFIIIFILLIIVGAGVGGYVYLKETTKTVYHSELSDRSKEFIASRTGERDDAWRSVNLDKKYAGESDFDSNRIIVPKCYSLVVPFAVSDDRQNDPCIYYAILSSPRGNMTTSLRTVGFQKVSDAPDVTFRQGKKEQYEQSSLSVDGSEYLIFTDITTGMEKTAFGMIDGKFFTLSLSIGASDEVKTRQMEKILESLELE